MITDEYFTLSNGVKIPKIGFGTWLIDNDKTAQAVRDAISAGYRHIDTAEAYGNEQEVGEGVRSCGLPREQIFVTTKLAAEIKEYNGAVKAIEDSLEKLDLDYIDLMIIHCPQPWNDFRGGDYFDGNRQAWKALEEAYKAGKIRAVGVSNFEEKDLDNILDCCTVKPAVNQIMIHIGNTPAALMDYCKARDILIEGYSPVAHGRIFGNGKIEQLAEKYGVSTAQLCIRYVLQLGAIPLPKTTNAERMKQNADIDFEISADDMVYLKSIESID